MEDKKLNSQESLELIGRMIQNTQNNLKKYAGVHCLLWGYLSLAVSIAVFLFRMLTHNVFYSNYLWFAIPIIGFPTMWIIKRHTTPIVCTFVDSATNKIWIPITVAIFAFSILFNPLMFIMLLLSIAIAQTGLIIKYPAFTIAGFLGLATTWMTPYIRVIVGPDVERAGGGAGNWQILVFAFFSLVVLVIPGHLLNRKAARDHVQRA